MQKITEEFLAACKAGLVPDEDLRYVRASVSGRINSDKRRAAAAANCHAYWGRVMAEKKARAEAGLPPIPPTPRGPRPKTCKACGIKFYGKCKFEPTGGFLCPECKKKGQA